MLKCAQKRFKVPRVNYSTQNAQSCPECPKMPKSTLKGPNVPIVLKIPKQFQTGP